MTGYLTQVSGKKIDDVYRLVIPNKEVREVFVLQIQEWFKETIQKDAAPVKALSQAFLKGESDQSPEI